MNARGLMELIIINIGLQRRIISEGLFASLVIMAVITTLMASPIFDRLVGSGFAEAGGVTVRTRQGLPTASGIAMADGKYHVRDDLDPNLPDLNH
jgi:hypothetical protein